MVRKTGVQSLVVILKTQKWYLIYPCLTRYYKVRIKGKVEKPWKSSNARLLHLGVQAIEKGSFGLLSTTVANFIYIYIYMYIVIHRQTVSLYHNSSVGRFNVGSKPTQRYIRLSIIPPSQLVTYVSSGIISYNVATFVCLYYGYQIYVYSYTHTGM